MSSMARGCLRGLLSLVFASASSLDFSARAFLVAADFVDSKASSPVLPLTRLGDDGFEAAEEVEVGEGLEDRLEAVRSGLVEYNGVRGLLGYREEAVAPVGVLLSS